MLCQECNRGIIYCGECDLEEYDRRWPETANEEKNEEKATESA